jgi:uncharacterized membrane protein YjgN (DUF898 family)
MWKKDNPDDKAIGQVRRDAAGLMGVPGRQPEAAAVQPLVQARPMPAGGAAASPSFGIGAALGAAAGMPADWRPLVSFEGTGWGYFKLLAITFLFSLFTLGVYSFWGRTAQRAYLWSSTRVLGEPLEYTGTGKELFISFCIAMPLVLVGSLILGYAALFHPLAQAAVYLFLLFAWQFASYRALRYRLTRTRWRGIRGNLGGSASAYAVKAMGYLLAAVLSLGLAYPWVASRLVNLRLNNVWFGDRRLAFNGAARPLYASFLALFGGGIGLLALCLGGAVLTLYQFYPDAATMRMEIELYPVPLISVLLLTLFALSAGLALLASSYHAGFVRWLYGHMLFGRMRCRSKLSGMQVLLVRLTNMLLLLATLGFGYGWAFIRELRLHLSRVEYDGDPELTDLHQDTLPDVARGEGLLEALDVDMAF